MTGVVTNELSIFSMLNLLRNAFTRESAFDSWKEREKNHKENWTKETLEPSIPRYAKCVGRMLRAMYEAQFEDQIDITAVKYLGDKLPMYYEENIEALEALIGGVSIIHISRNPIDTINSMLRRSQNAARGSDTWNLVHTLDEGCKLWARAWNADMRFKAQRGGRVVHLKYEDVLGLTAECLASLSSQLGVESSFEASRIISEDPAARDLIGADEADRINNVLGGIAAIWSLPLPEVEAKHPWLPM